MKKFYHSLSLALRGDTFYDGTERVLSCLRGANIEDAYLASEITKLNGQKELLRQALHYKAAVDGISVEALALRRNAAALKRQVKWWMQFGSTTEQASASRLTAIVDKYGAFNRLTISECRTVAEMLLRDFGTEQSQADVSALSGVQALTEQLDASLVALREKQAEVDAITASTVKPASLHGLKCDAAETVNDIMEYLVVMVKAQPDVFTALHGQVETILDDANTHKRRANQPDAVAANDDAAQGPA